MPIEWSILDVAASLQRSGQSEFHGYALARALADDTGARSLTAHGTLYRALDRMERAGLLTSRWEDATPEARRPPRRLYALTAAGSAALATEAPGEAHVRWLPA